MNAFLGDCAVLSCSGWSTLWACKIQGNYVIHPHLCAVDKFSGMKQKFSFIGFLFNQYVLNKFG